MKCPHCETEITVDRERCPSCDADLGWLRSMRSLKRDLASVHQESVTLGRRIADLRRSLVAVESEVARAGAMTPEPAPTAGTPGAREPVPEAPQAGRRRADHSRADQPVVELRVDRKAKRAKERAHRPSGRTEVLVAQRWFLVIGIAAVVLGIAFFLKYAFDRDWIAPVVRIAMAYAAALALGGFGELCRRRRLEAFGLALSGGGIAAAYFATFAAHHFFALIPTGAAFGVMGAVTAIACALALLHDGRLLAVLGLVGGFLTPVVLASGEDRPVVLFNYLAILNLGSVAIAGWRRWSELLVLGFAFTWFLLGSWFAAH